MPQGSARAYNALVRLLVQYIIVGLDSADLIQVTTCDLSIYPLPQRDASAHPLDDAAELWVASKSSPSLDEASYHGKFHVS